MKLSPIELEMLEAAIVFWLEQLQQRQCTKPMPNRPERIRRFQNLLQKVRDAQVEGSHVRV